MSAQAESPTLEVAAGTGAVVRWWRAIDRALAWAGERLNPILDDRDHLVLLPEHPEPLSPLVSVVPLQLLAYHIAVARGCDVDQPRNLAKSVTVE